MTIGIFRSFKVASVNDFTKPKEINKKYKEIGKNKVKIPT